MMRLRVTRGAVALLLGAFLVSSLSTVALGQATVGSGSTVAIVGPSVIADVLQRGQSLESERRWAEAFALYETTARQNPGQTDLEHRLDIAKLHFDLGRRYSDSSFRNSIATLPEDQALDLFTDAATKVQSHYVVNPDWAHLIARGCVAMEVALSEPMFLENNLPNVEPVRVNVFVQELRGQMAQHTIRNRIDARETVADIARLAQVHLGLRPASVVLEYTAAMMGGLDEYSALLTAGQLNDLYSQIEGNFVGLGVELKAAENALLIVNVIHGSPAEKAGLQAGDRIVQVGNKSTADLSTDQAADLLQGPEGSVVELNVVTGNDAPRHLALRRQHVEVPSIDEIKLVDRDFGIGYFKLTCFQKTTAHDLDTALWQLQREGMRSLIIDLRGNPGGLLTSAVEVADRFIDQGGIVTTKGRSLGEDYNYTAHREGTWRVPLVILIDGDSASAAEILAGALRDHQRATIVGVRSYGKGSVQGIFPLDIGGTGVRITTAKFYSPAGKPFARVGVEPEIQVRTAAKPVNATLTSTSGPASAADDAIFNAGLNAARRLVAQR